MILWPFQHLAKLSKSTSVAHTFFMTNICYGVLGRLFLLENLFLLPCNFSSSKVYPSPSFRQSRMKDLICLHGQKTVKYAIYSNPLIKKPCKYVLDQAEWGGLVSPERWEIFIAVFGLLIYCIFRNTMVNGL